MASRKIKRKIWVLSLATTMISIGIMMYIPTLYFQVLPILIPSSIITVIMPTYFLEPNKSTNKENETKNTNNGYLYISLFTVLFFKNKIGIIFFISNIVFIDISSYINTNITIMPRFIPITSNILFSLRIS